ncbi:MAG TPA: phasin family protein [Rudaea sp.]
MAKSAFPQEALPIAAGFEAVSEIGKESFSTLSSTFRSWFENANRVQAEAFRFLNARMAKDFEAISQLANCRKPEDVFKLQREFATAWFADYAAANARFYDLMQDTSDKPSR